MCPAENSQHPVRAELDGLRHLADTTSVAALRDGSWLVPFLDHALGEYADANDHDAVRGRWPDLDLDGVADARIDTAQRHAALAGGLSAAGYASVVMVALASGGLASAVALPTAVGAFALDTYYTARVQLRLGWDLAVLYQRRFDLDDPRQASVLAKVAFGLDTDRSLQEMAGRFAPEASRLTTRAATTAVRLATGRGLRTVGQQLVARNLAKFAMPAIGVPLCAGVNHYTTGVVGAQVKRVFRGQALASELAEELAQGPADPTILVDTILMLVQADGRVRAAETTLMRELLDTYTEGGQGLEPPIDVDVPGVLARIRATEPALQRRLYSAAVAAVALDGTLHSAEDNLLREVAAAAGVVYDPRVVTTAIVQARD